MPTRGHRDPVTTPRRSPHGDLPAAGSDACRRSPRRPERGPAVALPERLTIRSLYLYLVCLVTLVIALFAAVELTRSTVGPFYPDPGNFGYGGPGEGRSEAKRLRREGKSPQSQRRNE